MAHCPSPQVTLHRGLVLTPTMKPCCAMCPQKQILTPVSSTPKSHQPRSQQGQGCPSSMVMAVD